MVALVGNKNKSILLVCIVEDFEVTQKIFLKFQRFINKNDAFYTIDLVVLLEQ